MARPGRVDQCPASFPPLSRYCRISPLKGFATFWLTTTSSPPATNRPIGLEYMSNTRKAHAGTLAAEIRRQKRYADAEGLASKLCKMTGRGSSGHPKKTSCLTQSPTSPYCQNGLQHSLTYVNVPFLEGGKDSGKKHTDWRKLTMGFCITPRKGSIRAAVRIRVKNTRIVESRLLQLTCASGCAP